MSGSALGEFVGRVIARLEETPVDCALLGPAAVPASLFSGGAGVAFFLHEAARLRGEERLLPLAGRWCRAAREQAALAPPSQWNGKPLGFFIGEGGLSYVEALLAARAADREGVVSAVDRIDRAATLLTGADPGSAELLGGAAGIVCATRDLDARLPREAAYQASRETLGRVRDRAVDLLLAKHGAPLRPSPKDFLGFAHGTAGELWALVTTVGADHELVRARLTELAALRELDEDGLGYWRPTLEDGTVELLGTWCNGMAGHTLLWCEVARRTRSDESMERARMCAESAAVLLSRDPSVCCGLAGHSLALRRYAELSGDARAARGADRRIVTAAKSSDGAPFLGLWQGALGIALVAMTRLRGEKTIACLEPPAVREGLAGPGPA